MLIQIQHQAVGGGTIQTVENRRNFDQLGSDQQELVIEYLSGLWHGENSLGPAARIGEGGDWVATRTASHDALGGSKPLANIA